MQCQKESQTRLEFSREMTEVHMRVYPIFVNQLQKTKQQGLGKIISREEGLEGQYIVP